MKRLRADAPSRRPWPGQQKDTRLWAELLADGTYAVGQLHRIHCTPAIHTENKRN